MPQRFRIRIDLPLLKAHLEAEDKEPKTDEQVLQWLRDARFHRNGDGTSWMVDEGDLGQLDPAEVIFIEPVGPPDLS